LLNPVADFSAGPTQGNAPLLVQFNNLSTNLPTSWSWNFGDSNTSTEKYPTHTYTQAGTYTVQLIAANAAGANTKTRTSYITVSTTGTISADPTTLSIPSGQQGQSTITWSTTGCTTAQVYKSTDGGVDSLFQQGASGTAPDNGIQPGHTYTFKLYAETNKAILIGTATVQGVAAADQDSDADGIADWWEVSYFGSPANCAPNADPDGDGVINRVEFTLKSNPTVNDLPGPGIHYEYDAVGRIKKIYRIPAN